MPKSNSPATAATNEDQDLPQTAVKPRQKDLLLQQMQDKLAEYEEGTTPAPAETSTNNPVNTGNEEETFKKRYSDLRRHAQQKEATFSKEVGDLKAQIKQLVDAQNQPLPKTREEFEAWKAKFPDIVGFIEIIAEERAGAAKAEVTQELETVKSKLSQTEKEKALATLHNLVPDVDEVKVSPEFISWFNEQPMFVQEILNTSDDPHQIAYYFNVFKVHTMPKREPTKEDKLKVLNTSVKNSGVTPSNNAGKWTYTQSQIFKMSPAEYEAQEKDILAARAAGKILDDMSKRNTVFDT